MNINLKLFAGSTYNFVQQSMIKPLTEQQKKIAIVAAAVLGFLAACYIISRCCLKGNHQIDAPSPKGDQPKVQLSDESQVKDNPKRAAQKHEEQVKENPVDQADQKAASPKDEKLEAKNEEKKGDQPVEKEQEPSEPPELPVEPPMDEPAGDEILADQEPVSPAKTDDPKKTITKTAEIIDLHAGIMVQAIDDMLEKDDTLSQDDKDELAALKDKELKKKDLMQSIIDLEQEQIFRLKEQLKYESQRLDDEQARLDNHLKNIKELEEKIAAKKNSIDELGDEIANLSRGVRETILKIHRYHPDDLVEKNGVKYKASEFVGKLTHECKLDKGATLVSEDDASDYDLNEYKYLVVMKGAQFALRHKESFGSHSSMYWFETEWKGDGVLPWFELVWLSLKADYNEASIINADSDLRRARRDLDELREKRLHTMQQDVGSAEVRIRLIKDSIARIKASLQEKGEPA